jgi:hypothetical protein
MERRGCVRLVGLTVGMLLLWPLVVQAEVATEGTLGARVRLTGKNVTVPAGPRVLRRCRPFQASGRASPLPVPQA